MFYEPTHFSRRDGSLAMFLAGKDGLVEMINEDGQSWVDPATLWVPIGYDDEAHIVRGDK